MTSKGNRFLPFIIVIAVLALWIDFPGSPGLHLHLGSLAVDRSFATRLGLDLVGGVQALLEADLPPQTPIDPEAMRAARAIVERRVNGLGVSEAVVQQAGDRRILVELPGETDPEAALASVQKTGLLEFVDFFDLSPQEASQLDQQTIATDFGLTGSGQSSGQPALATVPPTQSLAPTQILTPTLTVIPAQTPAPTQPLTLTLPLTTTQAITPTAPGGSSRVFHTVMTGAELKNVGVRTNAGKYVVSFELSSEGARIFSDVTSKNVGKILAIVLDKKVISIPRINSAITDGKGIIEGNFTLDSANELAVQLRYGSLPIPLKVVSSQTVGPTLGMTSLRKSLVAGLIGLSTVVLFMALYYRLPGLVADLALILYALVTLALFKLIPVTLTLPGIAGFVLSIGMAVDANILIFSRMKEELRAGRPLHQAIDFGWSRAWPSIRDANISTLITCFILFWFGSIFGASLIKGFSLTLAIGVLISMFTAIIVSRTFLHLALDNIPFAGHHRWFGVME